MSFVAWAPVRAQIPVDARAIYLRDCATCHGADGAGSGRSPSVLGAGRAGVDFYLSTGRMPLQRPTEAVERHAPKYDRPTIDALTDYVATLPSFRGPEVPTLD